MYTYMYSHAHHDSIYLYDVTKFESVSSAAHNTTYSSLCNTLQHTATRCTTLHSSPYLYHVKTLMGCQLACCTHCNTLQHAATQRKTLQHTTYLHRVKKLECGNSLAHTATRCNTFLHVATQHKTLYHTTHLHHVTKLKGRQLAFRA